MLCANNDTINILADVYRYDLVYRNAYINVMKEDISGWRAIKIPSIS